MNGDIEGRTVVLKHKVEMREGARVADGVNGNII